MSLSRVLTVVGGFIGAGVAGSALLLDSRWGRKAKSSVKEFHRPSYNPPPEGWTGPTFKPKLDFHKARPMVEEAPWKNIDYQKEPVKYMKTVLEYCFDGNVENDFVPQKNTKRQWYHAPWMCQCPRGREPIHGLTFERPAREKYLAETQKRVCQTWAVALYNEPGGYAFNQIWHKVYEPDIHPLKFPSGSVAFKLLFSEATPADISFLKGSPEWKATLAKNPRPCPSKERTSPQSLHLIQIDVAVRDSRADDTTGWVFATFMYHDSVKEDNPWKRLMPVCLMWGNDPTLTPERYNKGERPKESWVNPDAIATLPPSRPYFGWLGRGNGPVDKYKSSCISCHSTANYPSIAMSPDGDSPPEHRMQWFRNIKAGNRFGFIGHPLDYSLQMKVGLDNYERWSQRWVPRFAPLYLQRQTSCKESRTR